MICRDENMFSLWVKVLLMHNSLAFSFPTPEFYFGKPLGFGCQRDKSLGVLQKNLGWILINFTELGYSTRMAAFICD